MAQLTSYSGRGVFKDRKGFRVNGMSLTTTSFEALKVFLDAMAQYSNLGLQRYLHTTTVQERKVGAEPGTGHFDLAGYSARLRFFNYSAEDAGDSPATALTIPGPKDDILEETKTGIWVVKEEIGIAIANLLKTALGSSEIEFLGGEVPEN